MTTLDKVNNPLAQKDGVPVQLAIPCLYQESVQTQRVNQSQERNSSRLWMGIRERGQCNGRQSDQIDSHSTRRCWPAKRELLVVELDLCINTHQGSSSEVTDPVG
jgi:hypothetical protein